MHKDAPVITELRAILQRVLAPAPQDTKEPRKKKRTRFCCTLSSSLEPVMSAGAMIRANRVLMVFIVPVHVHARIAPPATQSMARVRVQRDGR